MIHSGHTVVDGHSPSSRHFHFGAKPHSPSILGSKTHMASNFEHEQSPHHRVHGASASSGNVSGNFWSGMGHPPSGPEGIVPSPAQQERDFIHSSPANAVNGHVPGSSMSVRTNLAKNFHDAGSHSVEKLAGVKRRASYDLFSSAMEGDDNMEQNDSPSKFDGQDSEDIDATASAICQRIMNVPLAKRQRKFTTKFIDNANQVHSESNEGLHIGSGFQPAFAESAASMQNSDVTADQEESYNIADENSRLNNENRILKRGITLLHSKYVDAQEKAQNAELTISRLEEELKIERAARYALEVHVHALDGNLKNSFTNNNFYGEGY